jgi:hypothetical protein
MNAKKEEDPKEVRGYIQSIHARIGCDVDSTAPDIDTTNVVGCTISDSREIANFRNYTVGVVFKKSAMIEGDVKRHEYPFFIPLFAHCAYRTYLVYSLQWTKSQVSLLGNHVAGNMRALMSPA